MIRPLTPRVLIWCAFLPLLLQCVVLSTSAALTWPTWAMVICALLKLRECRRPFDRRLVALLQLLSTGLLAAQLQGLMATALQLMAACLALAGLLAAELGGTVSFQGLIRRSLQLLGAALPLALVLFLFVPRIPPLWTAELGPARGAVTGLSPDLDPLSIAKLASVDASAARMTVPVDVDLPVDAYWRVLVHEQFDGRRWRHRDPPVSSRSDAASSAAAEVAQWWVVEPSATRAVPWDGETGPAAPDQWVNREGEFFVGAASRQRRAFRVLAGGDGQDWRRRPPIAVEREFPFTAGLPRLRRLADGLRALPSDRDRLAAVEQWFRRQPFRYSLQPGPITDLDSFLFDRQEGFCGHYASAVAALLRSADVPTRVVSGYRGGRPVQPMGGRDFLDIRQSDAHAWVEVWLEGSGWNRVDPTLWIASSASAQPSSVFQSGVSSTEPSWWQWLRWQWWGLDLVWTRWWLSFDQSSQQAWLNALFGDQQHWLGLLLVLASVAATALGWVIMRESVTGRQPLDQSLRLLARLGVVPHPGESFSQLCRRAANVHPDRALLFTAMAEQQQLIAHARLSGSQRREHLRRWRTIRRHLRSSSKWFSSVSGQP